MRPPGSLRIGLRNMGNTCYMNAGLQCLLATPGLGAYFAGGLFAKELSRDNPIGFGGRVAWSFGQFVRSIGDEPSDVVVPSRLKSDIGTCHPEFAGFRQHDAQEMLSWLLDALHEDLNRVRDKPPVTDPDDVDPGRPDAELAAEFWANHLKRNQSVVVDLFHGQIKSRLVCNDCRNVSRKFEVFSSLSLPLPLEDMRLVEVLLHPATSPSIPTRYGMRLPKNAQIMDLKVKLFELSGHKPRTLALFSVWNSRHDRLFGHTDRLDLVRDGDTVHAYVVHGINAKLQLCSPPPKPYVKVAKTDGSDDDEQDDLLFGCIPLGSSPHKASKAPPPNPKVETMLPANTAAEEDVDADDPDGGDKLRKQAGAGAAALDVCYVQVMHRRVEKAQGAPLFNASVPRLFGVPFVLSMRVAQYSTEALYAEVWARVKHLISHDYHLHKDDESSEFPFRLSVVEHSGLACGVCHWNKVCIGCALSDAHIDTERGLQLAIDWHLPVLRLYYNTEVANRAHMHESVKRNRDLQDYPVSLDECLRLFSTEEQLEDWYCGKCKKHGSATKSLAVYKMPTVLALHLKRFQLHRGEVMCAVFCAVFRAIQTRHTHTHTHTYTHTHTERERHVLLRCTPCSV